MVIEVNRRVDRRHRATALVAAVALGITGLAGCGSSGSGNSNTAKTTSSTSAAAASASKAAVEARRAALKRAGEQAKAGSASGSHTGTGATGRLGLGHTTATGRSSAGSTAARASAHRATEQLRKAFTDYVSCLKTHGISVPAATTKSGLPSLKGVNTRTPQYRTAAKACEQVVMKALRHSK